MKRILTKDINKNFDRLCINCKYFIKHWAPYDEENDHTNYGKCKIFGEMNLITGDTTYDYAKLVRNDESQCGLSGKLFEKRS